MRVTVKAAYTITELCELTGLGRSGLAAWLQRAEVPVHKIGKLRWVMLSELKAAFPELWDSIVERVTLEGTDDDEDDHDVTRATLDELVRGEFA